MAEDEILTSKETKDFLKLPARTLSYLITTGQILFSRVGKRSVRFRRSRLMQWLQERENVEYRRSEDK